MLEHVWTMLMIETTRTVNKCNAIKPEKQSVLALQMTHCILCWNEYNFSNLGEWLYEWKVSDFFFDLLKTFLKDELVCTKFGEQSQRMKGTSQHNPDFSVQSGKISAVVYFILHCACEPRQISTQILIKLPACGSAIGSLCLRIPSLYPHKQDLH